MKAVNSVSRSQIRSAGSLTGSRRQPGSYCFTLWTEKFIPLAVFWLLNCHCELVIYLFVLIFELYLNVKWENSVMLLLGEENHIQMVLITIKTQLFALLFSWYIWGYSKCLLSPSPKAFSMLFQLLYQTWDFGVLTQLAQGSPLCSRGNLWSLHVIKTPVTTAMTNSAPREPDMCSWTLCTEYSVTSVIDVP